MLANTDPIHPLPANSAILFSLLEEKKPFFEFVRCTRDLIFGFLADCPIGDGNVMKTAYIASKHEDEWNLKHDDVVACAMRVFDSTEGPDLLAKNPKAYEERRYRVILEKEVESLFTELETEYPNKDCGYIQLKSDDETYLPRWHQVFLNSEVGATQEDADKLLAANDVILLRHDVCCDDDQSGGRSVLGRFSHTQVSPFIRIKAREILERHGSLERVPAEERNIVWINSLYDLLASVNTILYGSALKTVALQLGVMGVAIEPIEAIPNTTEIRPDACERTFTQFRKHITQAIEEGKFPETYQSVKIGKDNADLISDFANKFFIESNLVYSSLSQFLTLLNIELQVPLENEFARLTISPRQNLRRSAGPEASQRPEQQTRRPLNKSSSSLSDLMAASPRSPRPQALVSPRASPRESPKASPRTAGSSLTSPRTCVNSTKNRPTPSTVARDSTSPTGSPRKLGSSQELNTKRLAYYNVLLNTLEVFKRLQKA